MSASYLRDHWISTRLQSQRTTIEILDRIFANPSRVRAITTAGGVFLFLVIRIDGSGSAVSSVTCHL